MNRKISFPIAIIIILICAVFVAGLAIWCYLCTPKIEIPEFKLAEKTLSAVDTTGWKTYRNEEYGFEIKYPPKYRVATETATDVAPAIKADSYAQIIFRDFTGDYTKQEIENIKKNSEKIKIGTLEAFKSDLGGNMDGGVELSIAFFDRPKAEERMYFNILFCTLQPGKEEELGTFYKMLSTFRFLE